MSYAAYRKNRIFLVQLVCIERPIGELANLFRDAKRGHVWFSLQPVHCGRADHVIVIVALMQTTSTLCSRNRDHDLFAAQRQLGPAVLGGAWLKSLREQFVA